MKKVLVGGCFDLIHFGHISFLTTAKSLGDYLIVALESDENVMHAKGPSRPIHSQLQRKKMLETLRCVDEVVELPLMKTDEDYGNLVKKIKPDIIAITAGDPVEDKKRAHAASIDATLTIIEKIHTPSTSQLAKLLGLE